VIDAPVDDGIEGERPRPRGGLRFPGKGGGYLLFEIGRNVGLYQVVEDFPAGERDGDVLQVPAVLRRFREDLLYSPKLVNRLAEAQGALVMSSPRRLKKDTCDST
jgi:hypothetical protein